MCAFTITIASLFTADSSISRVDYNSLSDQTLMEMLIDGFDDESKRTYQEKDGTYLDVCEWSLVVCDDEESVVEITECFSQISANLPLQRTY